MEVQCLVCLPSALPCSVPCSVFITLHLLYATHLIVSSLVWVFFTAIMRHPSSLLPPPSFLIPAGNRRSLMHTADYDTLPSRDWSPSLGPSTMEKDSPAGCFWWRRCMLVGGTRRKEALLSVVGRVLHRLHYDRFGPHWRICENGSKQNEIKSDWTKPNLS